MSFNKISLFSLLCFTNYSHIIAMEDIQNIQQSIQQKLSTLDLNIIATTKALKLAEEQKNKDKIIYDNYRTDFSDRYNKSWFWQTPKWDDNAPEICNYKGEVDKYPLPYYPIHLGNGSEGKYNSLIAALSERRKTYSQFKDDFKRGKKNQDFDYLKLVDQDMQNYLYQNYLDKQTINEQ